MPSVSNPKSATSADAVNRQASGLVEVVIAHGTDDGYFIEKKIG